MSPVNSKAESTQATPTWHNLPHKRQLAILALSRFVDFFQMAALQTIMVHQLQSFTANDSVPLPERTLAHQAGVLQGAFTAAQILTSILWGRIADHPRIGRKLVLNIGLVGTGIGCMGVGFSSSYHQAVFWRFLSGAINGTVGAARTMVAERTPKPWHDRAFLLLPAAFNIANVAGPLLAGMLVDPFQNFSGLFGPQSLFGGAAGVRWMQAYPYAVANCLNTVLLFAEALLVHFMLEETLKTKLPLRPSDLNPIRIYQDLRYRLAMAKRDGYKRLSVQHRRQASLRDSFELGSPTARQTDWDMDGNTNIPNPPPTLPFRRIWTPNVIWNLISIAIFDFHMGAFANLWILFLAAPRNTPSYHSESFSVIKFSSGLGFQPASIGYAMAILGFIGVALQFLLYPWANRRFGLMRSFRWSLLLFPLAYALAPYLALLPSTTVKKTPDGFAPATGPAVWTGITTILLLQVTARTFALPATILLLNNASPHPSVLATIHGLGGACSATFRTIGPVAAAYWYGIWAARGVVGMAWWFVAAIAAFGWVASFWVRNGSGHEVFLPGEEGKMKEEEVGVGGSGDGR